MSAAKVLVVGGGGFLGAEVVNRLTSDGFDVRSMGRRVSPILECEQIVADISVTHSYESLLSHWRPEIVIQSAWITNQKTYRVSSKNSIYLKASPGFAEKCFQSGTEHFLALGSSAEYGVPTEPCDASSTVASPVDLYGISKLKTLEKLRSVADAFSGRLSWARIFQPYGRYQDAARFIPRSAADLLAGKVVRIENPDSVLDWISSRDVASALVFALQNPVATVFDVGTSIGVSVAGVLEKLTTLLGISADYIEIASRLGAKENQFRMVLSKNSPLFGAGWSPQDNLDSGLRWSLSI